MFLTSIIQKGLNLSQDCVSIFVICGNINSSIVFKIYSTQFVTSGWVLNQLLIIFSTAPHIVLKERRAPWEILSQSSNLTHPSLTKILLFGGNSFDGNTNTNILNTSIEHLLKDLAHRSINLNSVTEFTECCYNEVINKTLNKFVFILLEPNKPR